MFEAQFNRRSAALAVLVTLAAGLLAPAASSAWEYRYGWEDHTRGTMLYAVAVDAYGNTFVGGNHRIDSDNYRAYLRKVGPDGIEVWGNVYPGVGELLDIHPQPDGNVLASSYTFPGAVFRKVDGESGATIWRHSPPRSDQFGLATGVLPNGNVMVSFAAREEPATIQMLDGATGAVLWSAQTITSYAFEFLAADDSTFWVSATRPDRSQDTWIDEYDARTGELRHSIFLVQEFNSKLFFAPDGNLIVVSGDGNVQAVSVRKYDRSTRALLWHTLHQPSLSSFSLDMDAAIDDRGMIGVCLSGGSHPANELEFAMISSVDGRTIFGPRIPFAYCKGLVAVPPIGWAFVAHPKDGNPRYGRIWAAGLDRDMTAVTWDHNYAAFGSPTGGSSIGIGFADGDVFVAGTFPARISPTSPEGAWISELAVDRVSAIDGLHEQLCGNGVLERGEHCDDGNIEDFDACPSRNSDSCRFTSKLARSARGPVDEDVSSCKVGWFAAEARRKTDRYGFRKGPVRCFDNDPACDYDPTPGICSFRVAPCLNNAVRNLPACEPDGIASVALTGIKVTPALTPGESPDPAAAIPAAVETAVSHLLDPKRPEDGHSNTIPIPAEKRDLCSEPMAVDVPLRFSDGKYKPRRVQIDLLATSAGATPVQTVATTKLICRPGNAP